MNIEDVKKLAAEARAWQEKVRDISPVAALRHIDAICDVADMVVGLMEDVETWRRNSVDNLSLAAEIAMGVTHSTLCHDETPCVRCRAEQAEAKLATALDELNEERACHDCREFREMIAAKLADALEGCRCQECGEVYREDVRLSDALWNSIRPEGKPEGSGLLCGGCIGRKIESRLKAALEENERLKEDADFNLRDPKHANCRNVEDQLQAQLNVERVWRERAAAAEAENERLRKVVESMRWTFEEIGKESDCPIPFYAYGDNEAAVDMAHRLSSIQGRAEAALAAHETGEEGK